MEKDREEWSREVERQRQERMEAIRERSRLAREKLLQKEKEAADHQNMVEEMLKDFHRLNPEWEARRQKVLRVSAGYDISSNNASNRLRYSSLQLKEERARVVTANVNGTRQIQTRSS